MQISHFVAIFIDYCDDRITNAWLCKNRVENLTTIYRWSWFRTGDLNLWMIYENFKFLSSSNKKLRHSKYNAKTEGNLLNDK